MWVLPSRSRPHNLRRLRDAWKATGASTPLWLRLDRDDPMLPAYRSMAARASWIVDVGPRVPLSAVYNDALERFPKAPFYGFIADDVVPETDGWDRTLAGIAGNDGMAVPAGGHDPFGAPHFVLGGDLVRDMGWLALPGLDRLYIDTVWLDIAKTRGVLRRVPEVVLKHHHFSNGMALMDSTYRKRNKAADRKVYETWKGTL